MSMRVDETGLAPARAPSFAASASRLPLLRSALERVPAGSRDALYYESFFNVGNGVFLTLYPISLVVLKTVFDGSLWHLTVLSAMFGGSSLLSLLVTYVGHKIPMRSLIIVPNILVGLLLLLTLLPWGGASLFTLIVGSVYLVRVFPRVAEINMYRTLYPDTHRSAAVGWLKAIANTSGLLVTLLSWWWLAFWPSGYSALYVFGGLLLLLGAYFYSRIPVPVAPVTTSATPKTASGALAEGLRELITNRQFLLYQFGFMLAGFANLMAVGLVAEVLKERITTNAMLIGLIVAVMPALLITASSPYWGRFLDRVSPMTGRSVFNALQAIGFALYAFGTLTRQVGPFVLGAIFHALGTGGANINWSTGNNYFSKPEHISLYNGVHVCLTGVRGLLAPIVGACLIRLGGAHGELMMFGLATVLATSGSVFMLCLGSGDRAAAVIPSFRPHLRLRPLARLAARKRTPQAAA